MFNSRQQKEKADVSQCETIRCNIREQWRHHLLIWYNNMKPSLHRKVAHSSTQSRSSICSENPSMFDYWCLAKKHYKQQRRTPLLFLTGRSPEVIFPLPWNKSMEHNSLWTIAHLLKSDVGWGASHHRAYSVCWQRRPLINKPVLWNRCPSMSSVLRGNSGKTDWLESVCYSACNHLDRCVSFPKSQRCFPRKQWCYSFFFSSSSAQ